MRDSMADGVQLARNPLSFLFLAANRLSGEIAIELGRALRGCRLLWL
jgi:hypothetical protein